MQWSKREMDWYYRGLKNCNYPQNVVTYIEDFLREDDTVIDIGTGIGTFALELAEIVNKVIAVDYSKEMLGYLEKLAEKQNIKSKIITKRGDWNKIDFVNELEINSLITAYSGQEVVGNKTSLQKMQKLINDYIFLFVPGEREKHSFSSDILFNKLGREKREHRCNYSDVERLLNDMKIDYNKKEFIYEFGQPFLDFKEAVDFFKFHYDLENDEIKTLKTFLKNHLKEKEDYLWIENKKRSVLYYWENKRGEAND
ncbi:MAG: class I SAM-dependent methyltransferase [Bacillota bacterium]